MKTYEEKCEEVLNEVFEYHAPVEDQIRRYKEIRLAAKHLARVILTVTLECADQSAAIRKLRETVMTANAAIALEKVDVNIPRR